MNKYVITIILAAAIFASGCSEKKVSAPSVIPQPVQMTTLKGVFSLSRSAIIKYNGSDYAGGVANYLAELLRPATGFTLKAEEGAGGAINLVIDTTLAWQPEEYLLIVDKKSVTLTGCTPAGLSRGVQTLRQLLPAAIENSSVVKNIKWTIPCVTVRDYPRFAWRGMHLDVSRHFFDVSFIKRYIDILAMHKMNVFHWHLVDDQGWRIEIKKYPLLTEVGALRVDREDKPWSSRQAQQPGENATYGGFYTQEEIREVVAYAAERHINVVPEIEMPAHVGSAMAAYPQYSCTGGPFTVPPGGVWPITDIYCAGKEETFSFLEDVLTEVMELFPSPYIHIGGDEANKTEWKKCPLCQARIHKEGLKDEAELQSWFVKRIEAFISSKGRHLIGWDEILEGGLAPGAAVMSWQGFEGGVAAAKSGHNAVMTPVSHCYFNVYQGDPATEPESFRGLLTLKKVYSFEPIPPELTPEESKFIIGAQGCLWTEYVSDGKTAEYMVLPRLTALSEVVWSAPETRSWEGFSTRLARMMEHFDAAGWSYSKGSFRVDMTASFNEESNNITLEMRTEQTSPEIRYTTDGSDPDSSSAVYESPLPLKASATVRAAIFTGGKISGKISEKKVTIHKATGKPVKYNLPFSDKYKALGDKTLVNGIMGSGAFDDGQWQGFDGTDLDIVIDLGSVTPLTKVSTRFKAATGSWIFLPRWVEISLSEDGNTFSAPHRIETTLTTEDQGNETVDYFTTFPEGKARLVRVVAGSQGICPPWHPGAGGKAWMFCDEVVID
jgi:hexosaminidase